MSKASLPIYVEQGQKRTIACAIDWPGWCRAANNEASAIEKLFEYAPRYAHVVSHSHLNFEVPDDMDALQVVERVKGRGSTDFGVPEVTTAADKAPFDEATAKRSTTLLRAYWRAFDRAIDQAAGKELRKGPRGGGRELDAIMLHVAGADLAYLRSLSRKTEKPDGAPREQLEHVRAAILDALDYVTQNELPTHGPRGGIIWTPRYFVRRVGWHVLDHVWEIEDRVVAE